MSRSNLDPHEMTQYRYPVNDNVTFFVNETTSNMERKDSPFWYSQEDFSQFESDLYKENLGDHGNMDDNKAWKSIDPRLVTLLEFFNELLVQRQEVVRKIFPGLQDEFVELSKKIEGVVSQAKTHKMKFKTMQRSLSVGSPRGPPSKTADEMALMLERFKIRTVVLDGGGGGQGGQGGAGDTNNLIGSS